MARIQFRLQRASPSWSARKPVTVQAAELSQAMATGVIESYMSSGRQLVMTPRRMEHIKYWYDTQAWLPKNAVIHEQGSLRCARRGKQTGGF